MKLSENTYARYVAISDNPNSLTDILDVITGLNKRDVKAYFPSLSISNNAIFYLTDLGQYTSLPVLKTGYHSLLAKLGLPFRLISNMSIHTELPLVNGSIIDMAHNQQSNVVLRIINNEIRAILSGSYTAIDDKEIITLLQSKYLNEIKNIIFNCDSSESLTTIYTKDNHQVENHGYITEMYLYINNSEIGDASVRCGIGINITKNVNEGRSISLQFVKNTKTIGRIIHRGDAISKLDKQITTLFSTASSNWNLIQNALQYMSTISVEDMPHLEDRLTEALKNMPEFEAWKLQYDEMRKTSVITNAFDLLYLMTSIPYRTEHFSGIVEEILFGRFF